MNRNVVSALFEPVPWLVGEEYFAETRGKTLSGFTIHFIMRAMHRLLLIGVLSIPLVAEDAILDHARQVNLESLAHAELRGGRGHYVLSRS